LRRAFQIAIDALVFAAADDHIQSRREIQQGQKQNGRVP
jgi:hypothetical protein